MVCDALKGRRRLGATADAAQVDDRWHGPTLSDDDAQPSPCRKEGFGLNTTMMIDVGAALNASATGVVAAPVRLLTTKEAATYLGYTSVRTLQNLRMRKAGPEAIKLPSGAVRYAQASLDVWAGSSQSMVRNEFTWQALRERERQEARKARDKDRSKRTKEART